MRAHPTPAPSAKRLIHSACVLALRRIAILLSVVTCAAVFAQDTPDEFFEKRIRPVLPAHCDACHSATKLGGFGMAKDGHVNTFRYRDWVIDAFNKDLPYDTFVKAQIAADQLPEWQDA